jgi:hypothetical protein
VEARCYRSAHLPGPARGVANPRAATYTAAVTRGSNPGDPDPFEGLVLDESFVASARTKEAAAQERMARARRIAEGHGQLTGPGDGTAGLVTAPPEHQRRAGVGHWRRWRFGGRPGPERPANRRPWLIVLGLVTLGLLVAVFLGGRTTPPGTTSPSGPRFDGGGGRAPTIGPAPSSLPLPTSTLATVNPVTGECLSVPDAGSATGSPLVGPVICTQAHSQQIVAVLTAVAGPAAAYPSGAAAAALALRLCAAAAARFVTGTGASLPSTLAYQLNLPSEPAWAHGARAGWCAVTAADGSPLSRSWAAPAGTQA